VDTTEKALKIGQIAVTGSFQLFVGKAASTVIMAIGTIFLARLMLPAEYGLYSVSLIPALMIGLFQDWGVGSAMTKYIAQYRTENKYDDVYNAITIGIIFKITMGLALSLLCLLLAGFIASTIFQRPESRSLISIASFAIFSESLLIASQSNFIGFERMELNSLTMICQSVIKGTASPLLVLLGYGALGAVLGYTFSSLTGGIIGLVIFYLLVFRSLKRTDTRRSDISKTLKTMLRFGVPLSMSSILGGFLMQFFGFMMAFFCNDVMIGNYQVATNFAVILTFLTFPIVTVLFPAFAKLDLRSEQPLLQAVFMSSVKYAAMLLVPSTMAAMVLSKPMVNTLFGERWVYAPFFLALYIINNLLVLFGSFVLGSLLAGLGETKMLMKLSILTLSSGVLLAFLLIPTYGIVGVILGNLLAGLPSTFWGLHWIWKHYQVKADFHSSTKICIASIIPAITTYFSLNFLNTAEWIRLLIGGIIFLTIYILTAPMIGAISQSDINNLRAMFSSLGIISRLIEIPLKLVEKTARKALHKPR